jgi:hypothetical protein
VSSSDCEALDMKPLPIFTAAALALTLAAAAPAAQAATIFASFRPANATYTAESAAANFRFVNKGASDRDSAAFYTTSAPGGTSAGATNVFFSFLGDPGVADFTNLAAKLLITGAVTDTPAGYDGATYTQTGLSGSFQFVYAGPTTTIDGFNLVSNTSVLFSGTFTNAWIQGHGGVGGIDVTLSNGGMATFASNYADLSLFDPLTDEFAFNLGSVSPNLGRFNSTSALNSFRASADGKFQAAAVPEPSGWALMILGFGAAGAILRQRRRSPQAA